MILLSEEEMREAYGVGGTYGTMTRVCKAQLKEVVEFIDWLDNGTRSSGSWRAEMRKFRQALLKEIE